MQEAQRQQLKKKKQKKFDRQKMIDEAHECDKRKWQSFTSKVSRGWICRLFVYIR